MGERVAYYVFLTIVAGGILFTTIALVAIIVFLVKQNRRARQG